MTLRYRTAGPWGAGLGSNLSAAQVDENFYTLSQALSSFTAPPGVGISSITMAGASMTVHLSDGSTQGPFVLPTAAFRFTGDYQPGTDYAPLDIFYDPNSGLYLVSIAYHSPEDDPFNPNVIDTDGNKLLQLVLPISPNSIPVLNATTEDTSSYTVQFFDQASWRRFINTGEATTTDPSAIEVHIPLDPDWAPGFYMYLQQGDGHQVQVVTDATSIVVESMETLRTKKQGAVAMLTYLGDNLWSLSGDLESSP